MAASCKTFHSDLYIQADFLFIFGLFFMIKVKNMKKIMDKKGNNNGFSLVELIIVIVILAILVGWYLLLYNTLEKAKK